MFPELPPVMALLIGLVLLVKGADWLVDGGVRIARRLGISPMMVGLTIIAWGTSLPELVVTTLAAGEGRPGIALGSVLGSNIANIGLVLGATAIILPGVIGSAMRWREAGWLLAAVFAMWGVLIWENGVGRASGALLLALFVAYNLHLWKTSKPDEEEQPEPGGQGTMRRAVILVLIGSGAVALGAHWTVIGAESIARSIGVSDRVIGLTIVAIGTSLPELAAGVVSALKGQKEIGLGNVVGSNVFNLLVAVGAAGLVRPFGATPDDAALVEQTQSIDLPLVLCFSAAAILIPRLGPSGRWKGALLLLAYMTFLWMQF